MHRLIREDEVAHIYEDFAHRHYGHLGQTEVCAGSWARAFHCARCGTWDTFEVDNEERREVMRMKGSPDLSLSGVQW